MPGHQVGLLLSIFDEWLDRGDRMTGAIFLLGFKDGLGWRIARSHNKKEEPTNNDSAN